MKKLTLTVLTILLLASSIYAVASYGKSQKVIKIGVTSSTDQNMPRVQALIQLASEDIQQWLDDNGYDNRSSSN